MIINVECDELLYRAACSVEKQGYRISIKSHGDGIKGGRTTDFGNKYTATRIIQTLAKKGKVVDVDYTLEGYKMLIPDSETSLAHAIHTLKKWLEKIRGLSSGPTNLWLSPSDGSNFRNEVAQTSRIVNGEERKGYKEGRAVRPLHYQAIRDYLIEYQGAMECPGMEADDALGIHKGVMVHIDKDINMVAGKHYHWVTGTSYTVKDGFGVLDWDKKNNKLISLGLNFFYIQLLVGDSTDNIPSIKNPNSNRNFGPKTAYEYLKGCKTEKELFDKVKEVYYTVYKFTDVNWKERLAEQADLVWILQEPGVTGSIYLRGVK